MVGNGSSESRLRSRSTTGRESSHQRAQLGVGWKRRRDPHLEGAQMRRRLYVPNGLSIWSMMPVFVGRDEPSNSPSLEMDNGAGGGQC